MAEHAVLDLVPFAGARREVVNLDIQPSFLCESTEFQFPQANAMPVAAATIGRDDQLLTPSGGERTAELIPGSVFLFVTDMGHDVPLPLWPIFVDAISSHVRRAA